MGSIKDWFVKKFLISWLKGLLDKLPGNGYKTVLGFLLVAVGELAKLYPAGPVADVLRFLSDVLVQLDPATVTNVGAVALFVGLFHKLLKLIGVEKDGGQPAA